MSSLTDNFAQFVLSYQIQSKETSIKELINLVKTVKPTLKNKAKSVMLVDSSISKKGSKNNNRKKKPMKAKGGVTKKKVKEVAPKDICFHCGQDGHRKRNCKAYLRSLKKKASDAPSTLGMFVIEVNTVSHNNQWVLYTGCGFHICTNV